MKAPLLAAKLNAPLPRPVLVARPRLIEKVNAGRYRKLTLVSAPAGFGKTTLVSDWLRESDVPVAWLTFDEGDNDPARFLSYFLAALAQIDPKAGRETSELLQMPEPPNPELLMNTLLNEIASISEPFVMVLDDMQLIDNHSVLGQVSFIVERQPPKMHLVIVTREDPALPLSRLRARGQMTEIRQEDLRFTYQECADFLSKVMGLDVSTEDVATLERRTEGWIAGLQLAGLAMQSTLARSDQRVVSDFVHEFAGSNRYILDYLIEEVFERQSEDVRDFLLKTSILDRLCGELCDFVVERRRSQELLQTLEASNLFIVPLDQSRTWYRYHRLFGDLLRHRLHSQGEDVVELLRLRAAKWYKRQGMMMEAISHTLAAKAWDELEKMVASVSREILSRGQVVTMLKWLDNIPDEALVERPRLCFDLTWPLILTGQFSKATHNLNRIEPMIQDDQVFLGELVSAQAYLARASGDHARMIDLSKLALTLLPENDLFNRGIIATSLGIAYWHCGQMDEADMALAEAYIATQKIENLFAKLSVLTFQGRVQSVRGLLRSAHDKYLDVINEGGHFPISALAYLDLSALYYEWNDLTESARYLKEMMNNCRRNRNDEFLVVGLMMEGRLKIASGNIDEAVKVLDDAQALLLKGKYSGPTPARIAAAQLQLALARGDIQRALRFVDQLDEHADCHNFHRFINLSKAMLLIAQGKKNSAYDYLINCYKIAIDRKWQYSQIAILVLQVISAPSSDESLIFLEKAIKMAQSERLIRTFIDVGAALMPHLQEAARRGIEPVYVAEIMAALQEKPVFGEVGQNVLVEALSDREIEVLRLVAAGLSNREIGETLFISTGTAKTHVHNLCGKLDARNRMEAAERGKELGLL